jgi:hypothetical protein
MMFQNHGPNIWDGHTLVALSTAEVDSQEVLLAGSAICFFAFLSVESLLSVGFMMFVAAVSTWEK